MRMLNFAISALLAVMASTAAEAHAFLDHAEPRVGSTVPTAPREVILFYSQNLESAFSSIEVSDANGARVDLGKPRINAGVMRVGLKQLPPGTYKVRWQVLSVDTHTTEASFSFHVGKVKKTQLNRRDGRPVFSRMGAALAPQFAWRGGRFDQSADRRAGYSL